MSATLRRMIAEQPAQFRAAPAGSKSPGVLFGYACVFNTVSRDLGGWREVIDPVCFAAYLAAGGRVIVRAEHDSRLLLGTTDAGTARVTIDAVGVFYEVDLPDTNAGRDVAVLAARGDYRFSSFAFYEEAGFWDSTMAPEGEPDAPVWRVMLAELADCAPVADPAYWSSTAAKRDLTEARASTVRDDDDPDTAEDPDEPGECEEESCGHEPGAKCNRSADLALRESQTTAARLRLLNLRQEKGSIR
jgi:hypothetical protein